MQKEKHFNSTEDIILEAQKKIEKHKSGEVREKFSQTNETERAVVLSKNEQNKSKERSEKMNLIKKQIEETKKSIDDMRREKDAVAEKAGLKKAQEEYNKLEKDPAGEAAYKEVVRLQHELDDIGFLTLNPLKWIKRANIKRQLEEAVGKHHAFDGAKRQKNEEVWKLEAQAVGDINKQLGVYLTQLRLLEDEYKKLEKEEDDYVKAVQEYMTSRPGFNY